MTESSAIGHNTKAQLASIIERVERLEEEKKSLAAEAKINGFDVPALREIVKRRKADADKLAEHEAIVDMYMSALGMLADTPLGAAAIDAAKKEDKRKGKA